MVGWRALVRDVVSDVIRCQCLEQCVEGSHCTGKS